MDANQKDAMKEGEKSFCPNCGREEAEAEEGCSCKSEGSGCGCGGSCGCGGQ
ncbi:hypothetical protein M1439_03875 [Candidatus Marsarchaeota archaeon]|nr:hypothetical protein [Candidatus Marsarchaeota archaeon]MCL5092211.1 hypothetical protein [Candidatus Marsarchaeota archaeon]